MRAEVAASEGFPSSGPSRYAPSSPTSRPKATYVDPLQRPDGDKAGDDEDDQAAWGRMEQQVCFFTIFYYD